MKNNIYATAITEVPNYTDRDAYISDLALSSIWEDEEGAEIPAARLEWLGQIWDAEHRTFPEILAAAGLTGPRLAGLTLIPQRTVRDWASGQHTPPAWATRLLQVALGLVSYEPK